MRGMEKRTVEYNTFNYHNIYFSMVFNFYSLTMGQRMRGQNDTLDENFSGKIGLWMILFGVTIFYILIMRMITILHGYNYGAV